MKSIRVRLLVSILGVYMIAILILTVLVYKETSHEIEEVFDAELAQVARMINQLTLENIASNGIEISTPKYIQTQGHKYEKHVSYQVWFHDTLVLRSQSAPANAPLANSSGYSDTNIEGKHWRVFSLSMEESPYRIFTAEDYKARDELTLEIVMESIGIYLLAMPMLGIIIYFILNKGLLSLKLLSEDVGSRGANKLKPFNTNEVPIEVLPLVSSLNKLLARLDDTIAKEKRFTSDASHEIKTPLSSARLHAQLAIQAVNEENRQHAMQQVIKAVDKSTHLVDQMLVLARLDPADLRLEDENIEVNELYEEVKRDLHALIQSHDATVNINVSDSCTHINSNHGLLYKLLRNLVDNAIRHNSPGTTIELTAAKNPQQIELSVKDNGSGIPEAQLELVTERFYRVSGQEIDGCGLGLSITLEAVNKLGGELSLCNRIDIQSGLLAKIVFPIS